MRKPKSDAIEYRSMENMEMITGERRDVEHVGTRTQGRRRYQLYVDHEGMGWYKTQILTKDGWKEEEEAVFGRKTSREKRKGRRF